jgi:hypothetical protein
MRAAAFQRDSIQARRVRASRAKVRGGQAELVRKERVDRRDVQRGGRRGVQQGVQKQGVRKRLADRHRVQVEQAAVLVHKLMQRQRGQVEAAAVLVHKLTPRQRGQVEAEAAALVHRPMQRQLMLHRQPTAAAVAAGTTSSAYFFVRSSSSSSVRGQSSRSRRDNARSASSFPLVWHSGQ